MVRTRSEFSGLLRSRLDRLSAVVVGELPVLHVPAVVALTPTVPHHQGPPADAAEGGDHAEVWLAYGEVDHGVHRADHLGPHHVAELHGRPSHPSASPLLPDEGYPDETALWRLAVQVEYREVGVARLGHLYLPRDYVPDVGDP